MTKNAAGQSGFTLLEILIATGILAIGLVTVFSLFPIGIYAVRDAVEGTRGASLAESARSELTAIRADLRILDGGAQHYGAAPAGHAPDGYVPFGPWRYPGAIDTFRTPLYEYYDAGVLHERVVFDERRMVPAVLTGNFNGTSTVSFPAVVQLGLNRDSDRLEYYYAHPAAAGTNKYAPYEIFARVRGRKYQILDRTYSSVDGDGRAVSGADLRTLVLADIPVDTDGVTPLAGDYAFDILLPVAMREPPVDVPQEWAGGVATFTGGGTYNVAQSSAFMTRNLIRYLAVPAPSTAWISVPGIMKGDWFEVSGITRDGVTHIPQTITVANVPVGSTGGDEFKICVPLAVYSASGTFDIAVDSGDTSLVGGGGPQTSSLDTGADIEILLDGALATFSSSGSAGTARTIVSISAGTLNDNTKGLIQGALDPAGFASFIRVDGRDYEIATRAGMDASFEVFGSVPVGLNEERYFNIVLGYRVGGGIVQTPQVARFPVRTVTRPGVPPYGIRVTSFTVGPDANGNLPDNLGFVAGRPANPVHVLPRNHSQFSYEAVISQQALVGDFSTGDSNVYAPSWAADFSGPALGPIPYPPSLDYQTAGLNGNTSIYHMLVLSPPNLPVTPGDVHSLDIGSVDPGYLSVNINANAPFDASHLPFHAYDRNDFTNPAGILAGVGTFKVATLQVDFTVAGSTITTDAVFLAEQVKVELRDAGGMVLDSATILSVDVDLNNITLDNAGSIGADTVVNVFIRPTALGDNNAPIGRGFFQNGADVVRAWYPSDLSGGGLTTPAGWRGLPYTDQPALAHDIRLTVGDYIQGPDFKWYAVKAIRPAATVSATAFDYIILDRPYEGADSVAGSGYFRYVTPVTEIYKAQVAVFRNYRVQSLRNASTGRNAAAAFGFGVADPATGLVVRDPMLVHLAAPLPTGMKPGDYIRADGDADHPVKVGADIPSDPGLNDALDGDWRWYMIDFVSADRLTITLTSPYGGYVPASEADALQPASVTSSIVRTFDTVIGAF